jgi:hypothetical protein
MHAQQLSASCFTQGRRSAFDPEKWFGADPHLKVTGYYGRRGLWRSLGDHAVARLPAVRTQEIYGYDRNYCHMEITMHGRLCSGDEQGLFWVADSRSALGVTANPTAEWLAQQVTEACG